MEKRKVYFVQTGCVFNNEHFLPYSAGIIAAYAFENPLINQIYELSGMIYKSESIKLTAESVINPSVVAFSCSMWNYSFNLELAEIIKSAYPQCKIIFGGHQISDTSEWLEKFSFVDFAVYGEGETVISEILLELCTNNDFSHIRNISYRSERGIEKNECKSICVDLNLFPSPYCLGLFDKIVEENNDKFAAVIETSRGCPYHCAYCDWGDYSVPMRRFDVERVKKEIEWVGKNSVVFVVLADSNFGLYDSDEEIVDKFIEVKAKYGYPKAVEIAFAKHSPDRVFSMNKKLYESNMSRGATLSMQSLSPLALKNIGRENITKEAFSKLIKLYSENRIPSYTELILGLPGETYESFCEGIDYLLDNGQHNSIHVFCCEILPNAVMGSEEYIRRHKIEMLERSFLLRNGMQSDGIKGNSRIVVATESMNREMFLKSLLYSFIIQVFHNFGLSRVVALYFHYEKDMRYYEFYNRLMDWLNDNDSCFSGRIFKKFSEIYENFILGKGSDTYENSKFGDTQFNLSDGAFLEIMCSADEFYEDLMSFTKTLSDNTEIIEELLCFQRAIMRTPLNFEICEKYERNWVEYYFGLMAGNAELKKEKTELCVMPSSEYHDILSYAEAIAIKGRRIGKSIALNDKNGYKYRVIQ